MSLPASFPPGRPVGSSQTLVRVGLTFQQGLEEALRAQLTFLLPPDIVHDPWACHLFLPSPFTGCGFWFLLALNTHNLDLPLPVWLCWNFPKDSSCEAAYPVPHSVNTDVSITIDLNI